MSLTNGDPPKVGYFSVEEEEVLCLVMEQEEDADAGDWNVFRMCSPKGVL